MIERKDERKEEKPAELADPNPPMPTVPLTGPQPAMIWDDYKQAFVTRCAQARRDACNTALRPSNDDLEAALFLAMLQAYFNALPDGTDPIPVPEGYESAPQQHVIPKVKPAATEVPAEDEPPRRRTRHE